MSTSLLAMPHKPSRTQPPTSRQASGRPHELRYPQAARAAGREFSRTHSADRELPGRPN